MKSKFFFCMGFFLLLSLFFTHSNSVYAQGLDAIGIAEIYELAPEENAAVEAGDIIVLDEASALYVRASKPNDPRIAGIYALAPLLLFQTETEGVPLVRNGKARVSVTAINGPITAGDLITTSRVLGKGQKADKDTTYIVGVALEPFTGEADAATLSGVTTVDGTEIMVGAILVDLTTGSFLGATAEEFVTPEMQEEIQEREFRNTKTALQYIVAALVAIGSIYFAFRNFGASIQNSILSVGRNPLKKTTIQSTVILNLILILLISLGGLFLSFVILGLSF